jgi:hypothetical protein
MTRTALCARYPGVFLLALLACTLPLGCTPLPADGDGGQSRPADADGDRISDRDEGREGQVDSDGDGTPDYLDLDSDDDGIADLNEASDDDTRSPPPDSDGDGRVDYRDPDADGNGLADATDGTEDLDHDQQLDFADLDDDGDAIADTVEMGADAAHPRDSDGDGRPDHHDLDSDGDTISDRDEGQGDGDRDGLPTFRDLDSDGDCRPDAAEAGDADLATAPRNSDADPAPDYLDLDADADGLLDRREDLDCDGVFDAGDASDASDADTDDDGVSDLVELAASTSASDPSSNPQASGDFVFLVPYQAPPSPAADTLAFITRISQADVVFSTDTTGSMGGEIANLEASLASIIAILAMDLDDIGLGVVDFRDFSEWSFVLRHRVMTAVTAAGIASLQSAVNAMRAGGGGDAPEANWDALYEIAAGPPPAGGSPLPGERVGSLGGAGFRPGSLPIVVMISDAPGHDSCIDAGYDAGGHSCQQALDQLIARGGRMIGVVSTDEAAFDAAADARHGAIASGAVVEPAAWGAAGTRPAGCAASQCCTGVDGAGEALIGGGCPLVFRIDGDGRGLGTAIVRAIQVLTRFVAIDVGARALDAPGDAVDAVGAFVQAIRADPTAGSPCTPGLTAVDDDGDGVADRFLGLRPGTAVCFDVVPRANTTVPATDSPQLFRATIEVEGNGVTVLDTRDVFFLVPPVVPELPID